MNNSFKKPLGQITPDKNSPEKAEENLNLLFKLFEKANSTINSQKNQDKTSSRAIFFRTVRIVFAVLVIVIGLKLFMDRNTKVNSLQGFINTELVSINSPINGKLTLNKSIKVGQYIESKALIGTVENTYEDYINDLEIKRRSVISQIEANKKHLANLVSLLSSRQSMLGDYSTKSNLQKNLRVKYENDRLNQFEKELAEAKETSALSKREYERISSLIDDGYVSLADVDKAKSKYEQSKANLDSKKAQVEQSESQIKAASKGLQVEGSQSVSFHEARRRDLEVEILSLQQQASDTQLKIDLDETELEKINEQIKNQKEALIKMPVNGVVWSLAAKSGENIHQHQSIAKIINCRTRWVEAFVAEKDLGKVYIGAPVQVKSLNADSKIWNGFIESIRGGSNRVKVGEDVDILPPELVRRQMAVRVEVDWENYEDNQLINPREFCQVGNSVEVTFKKQKTGLKKSS